ncbi:hypothetical protein P7C70_g512, partial [Phenoliferia sp. Uapishka_3]
MTATTYMITGTNRGLGLALVRLVLVGSTSRIIAAARNPAEAIELQALAKENPDRLKILKLDLDVTDNCTIWDYTGERLEW